MTQEWDDGEDRRKRLYDDRRDPPRPSPDAARREDELPRELRDRESRRSQGFDDRRDHRRSPGRSDGRARSRSPPPAAGDWRSLRRRSPSPPRRRERSPSPPRPDPSHPALLCPDKPIDEELMMYGHGIEGLGFFHTELPDVPSPSL
nr:serine/arginine repetitive matrix protein 1-like [Aegilops tauschii subsp. strangulata]